MQLWKFCHIWQYDPEALKFIRKLYDFWFMIKKLYDLWLFYCECKQAPELDNQQVYLPRLYQFWMKKE